MADRKKFYRFLLQLIVLAALVILVGLVPPMDIPWSESLRWQNLLLNFLILFVLWQLIRLIWKLAKRILPKRNPQL